jgi:hypothetical protein
MANQEQSTGGNIVIIGPRNSGKTTYLAGLAYWSKRKKALAESEKSFLIRNKQSFTIHPLNDDAKSLQDQAERIIVKGKGGGTTELEKKSFRPTKIIPQGIDEIINEIDEDEIFIPNNNCEFIDY